MDIRVDRPKAKPFVGTSTSIATRYWGPVTMEPSSTAAAVVAGRMYMAPFNLPGLTIDRIGINVTAGAAGNCRLGLYSNNNGVAGDLILDAGLVDTTNIATVEATITAMVLPEWIWACALFEATPTCTHGAIGGGSGSRIGAGAFTGAPRNVIATQAYGALPSTPPSQSFSSSGCLIMLRKS